MTKIKKYITNPRRIFEKSNSNIAIFKYIGLSQFLNPIFFKAIKNFGGETVLIVKEFNLIKLIPKGSAFAGHLKAGFANSLGQINFLRADDLTEALAFAKVSEPLSSEKNKLKQLKNYDFFLGESLANFSQSALPTTTSQIMQKNLKPLLFEYLIKKNNQNGIGLDLKNKKLLNYNFNSSNNQLLNLNQPSLEIGAAKEVENKNWYLSEDLILLISAFFKSIYCLISKPKFISTNDKIIIEILYYITIPDNNIFKWYNFIFLKNIRTKNNLKIKRQIRKIKKRNRSFKTILYKKNLIKKTLFKLNSTNITSLYLNKFIILFKLLSSYFKKPIEFNLIRLHKSDYDSNILAQLFFLILKKKNIRRAIDKVNNKNKIGIKEAFTSNKKENSQVQKAEHKLALGLGNIPAYISGLYIQIGGRLMRESIIPRRTTKKFEKGAIATGKVNFLDSARMTKKNKRGAYTIRIAYAQNFYV